MKREFLKELELENEVIEAIMKEHGKTLNDALEKVNTLEANITTLQEQLTERDEDLKALKENATFDEEQKQAFEELQTRYDSDKVEWENKLLQNAKQSAFEVAVAKSGVIDSVALKAHLNAFVDEAEFKDGTIVGLDEYIGKRLGDDLGYLKPEDTKALGGEFKKGTQTDQLEKDVMEAFKIKE